MEIETIIAKQQAFFNSNKSKDVHFRMEQLTKFKKALKENEGIIYQAIYADYGKSMFDTYLSEISMVYHELNNCIRHIKAWSKPKRVATNFANFPAKSYIIPEPLGTTLVIGAWNYPYQLSLVPALTALAAGNTVILKPSELPANTSAAMAKIINENFPSDYFYVFEGGVKETTALLENRFDKIFFTGSIPVGRIIYQAAAKHLTPVTLELGGKCPTFVLADTNIKMTAKRIVWAKFLNAGQTCVAPDYILVDKTIEAAFLIELKRQIDEFYKNKEDIEENYSRIINMENFDRLCNLMDADKIYCGGNVNRKNRFISPTILHNITFEDDIMKDEIFGPILPVISFSNLDEAIRKVKIRPKPLACYVYAKSRKTIDKLLSEISFGGGAVNDSVVHLGNSHLPFGGVGLSGIGNYHGKFGFDSFSHSKSVLEKPFWLELNVKYAPYTNKKLKMLKWLLE